jgi:hypothetical protein
MSFSSVGGGGFQGGDALLAFAAVQQGRMNDEMTESMRIADLRSQAAADLSRIKSDIEQAGRDASQLPALEVELSAFVEKYGDEPALSDLTSTVTMIRDKIDNKLVNELGEAAAKRANDPAATFGGRGGYTKVTDDADAKHELEQNNSVKFNDITDETIQDWLGEITDKLDAAGTNDQLTMIHIKQLNDNINNSSGMVSGIIESRQNATASIINNIA